MSKYNVWNKWGKLKTVVLGNNYNSDFFQDIKNSRIRSALQRIADETQEDLENYKKVLTDFGCNVLQPTMDHSDSIMNYVNEKGSIRGTQGVPRAPLQPRDGAFVAGNKLFFLGTERETQIILENYNREDTVTFNFFIPFTKEKWQEMSGQSWGDYSDYKNDPNHFLKLPIEIQQEIRQYQKFSQIEIGAPSYTVVGRDIYVDQGDSAIAKELVDLLSNNFPNLRLNKLYHGGHSDGCFHTLKPGAILSLEEIQTYENTFPGWDVCYLPDQSWDKVKGFLKLKDQVGGKWWVPGEEDNNEFTNFVETWLQDWVGYAEESVFDVNVLVLDEHHVCVNNMNPTVIDFLKKHNMEPIHVPWRHRYFWDGGLHCITLDLEREGVQEDYFPLRGNNGVIDYGFN